MGDPKSPFAFPNPGVPIVGQPFTVQSLYCPVNAVFTCNCGGADTTVTIAGECARGLSRVSDDLQRRVRSDHWQAGSSRPRPDREEGSVMKYEQMLQYVFSTPWAMLTDELVELAAMLKPRAGWTPPTIDEMRARFGDGADRPTTTGSVAVIPVRGCLVHRIDWWGTSCERLGAMIDQVAADPNVPTILYDFETPGGTCTGIPELAAKMFALRGIKKQIGLINGMCASAGYWLAAQCDERVCIPTGQAGSIGVLWPPHFNLSGSLEQGGIEVTMISSGKFKTEWNPFERPSAEAKAVKQAQSDLFYSQFLKDVARGLDVTPAAVKAGYGEGRMLFAKDAKAAGLIDRIATMDDVLAKLTGTKSASGMRAEEESEAELAAEQSAETPVALADADADRARRRRLL